MVARCFCVSDAHFARAHSLSPKLCTHARSSPSRTIQRLDKHAAGGPPANCPRPRFFRPLTAPFHWRFTAGYSFYQVATCMIWFAVMAYTAFYMSNPFSDPGA